MPLEGAQGRGQVRRSRPRRRRRLRRGGRAAETPCRLRGSAHLERRARHRAARGGTPRLRRLQPPGGCLDYVILYCTSILYHIISYHIIL